MAEKEEKITEEVENTEANDIKEQVQQSNTEYDELNDRYKRVLAEFENYKKRSQKERESLYNSVLGDIITEMLPAIDNLQNAVKAIIVYQYCTKKYKHIKKHKFYAVFQG